MECDRTGCTRPAKYKVRLELRAHPGHKPALSTPLVHVCERCAEDVRWDDVVDESGWKRICHSFEHIGKARPERKYSNVLIEPITAGTH